MLKHETKSPRGILYVDDEDKSLKYFQKAYATKFEVFTAMSPAEGMEILRREAGKIVVVVSDQRMPETSGAQFLGAVREEFPRIIRILTTAYADLSSTISAVNVAYIYQYVVKPWDVDVLELVLERALDYSRILSERNELLAVKLSTLQRILCSDRVKWLLLHARVLPGPDRATFSRSLVSLIKALPENLNPVTATEDPAHRRFEIGGLIRDEFDNATRILDLLAAPSGASPVVLPAALVAGLGTDPGTTPALQRLLGAMLAGPGVTAESLSVEMETPADFRVSVRATSGRQALAVESRLFGLLTERESPELGVILLHTLQAFASAGATLRLAVGPDEFTFAPGAESDSAVEAIDALYEKFSAADISRL